MNLIESIRPGDVLVVDGAYDQLERRHLQETLEVVTWGGDRQTLYCRSLGTGRLHRYQVRELASRLRVLKRGQIVYEVTDV
jgi:hypothetical protein